MRSSRADARAVDPPRLFVLGAIPAAPRKAAVDSHLHEWTRVLSIYLGSALVRKS